MQNELSAAEAQLEQAKGQAEIQQIQAIIKDIISRIQARQVEMRKIAAETQKHISQSEKLDIDALVSAATQGGMNQEQIPFQGGQGMMQDQGMEGTGLIGAEQMPGGVGVGPESEMG